MTGTICTLQTPRAVALSVRLDAVDLDACSIVAFAQAMLDEGTIDGRPMTERERRLLLEASMEDIFDALEQHAAGLEEQHARQLAQSAAMAGFVEGRCGHTWLAPLSAP